MTAVALLRGISHWVPGVCQGSHLLIRNLLYLSDFLGKVAAQGVCCQALRGTISGGPLPVIFSFGFRVFNNGPVTGRNGQPYWTSVVVVS